MLKSAPLIFALSLSFLMSACLAFQQNQSVFSGRDGRSFEVKVNGVTTLPIPNRYLIDSNGYRAYEVSRKAVSDGSLCLSIKPTQPDLSEVKSITTTLVEMREDRPHDRWRTFTLLPYIHDFNVNVVKTPIEKYCVEEFSLTPRIKYDKLPPGTYMLSIHINTHKNWDAQKIMLTVQ